MKKEYRELDISIVTTFEEDTVFDGKLEFSKPLCIKGKFKGEINSNSFLLIDETADVEAKISANVVIIAGRVRGNVEGKEKVEIVSSGKLYGDIITPKLKIWDGVIFEGSCHMIKK
jgi:cytoskeletal protein CcmA (bactofilin family)